MSTNHCHQLTFGMDGVLVPKSSWHSDQRYAARMKRFVALMRGSVREASTHFFFALRFVAIPAIVFRGVPLDPPAAVVVHDGQ